MINRTQNQYLPDYVSPPGETLQETLEALGMSQAELAERTGRPKKTINEIIVGKAAITSDTALQLERVLGVPATFWNNREQNYRDYLARRDEQNRLKQHIDWLKNLPVRAMIKAGWIQEFKDKTHQLQEVLTFFGVTSPRAWEDIWTVQQAAFRKSKTFESDAFAVAAWLRRGEIEAREIVCEPFDADKFRSALKEIRSMTHDPKLLQTAAKELCAAAGVAVVIISELPKARVCGAARWLTPYKALIQLSLRYKRADSLFFAFFHEAGHILLHPKRRVFLECSIEEKDGIEHQADRFAVDWLIPSEKWQRFVDASEYSKSAVLQFSTEIEITPGIVVGRLQHEKLIQWDQLRELTQPLSLDL